MESVRIIKRYSEPTKMDTADYLTLCEVGADSVNWHYRTLYIQLSHDAENPRWEHLGVPSENAFLKLIEFLK